MTTQGQDNAAEVSWRRLWWAALLVFGLQVVLIIVFAANRMPQATNTQEPTRVHLLVNPATEQDVFDVFLASDPTSFVVPSEQAFSGEAWLKVKNADYVAPEWNEPPRWLALNREGLGRGLREYVRTNTIPKSPIAGKISEEGARSIITRNDFVDSRPFLRVTGSIADRLRSAFEPQTWTNSEPVLPSNIQVGINGAGEVISARLIGPRSGLRIADEAALKLVQTAVFQAVNTGPTATNLSWGTMSFLWRTAPVATNGTNTTASVNAGG